MISELDPTICRVVLIGDSSVGKTSILNRYTENKFSREEKPTIGAANHSIYETLPNGQKIEMQIWDTAGQEKFRSLAPIYYRSANAAIAVFDQSTPSTFDSIDEWINSFKSIAGRNTTIAIVSNKSDIETNNGVPMSKTREYAERNGYLAFQTSALIGDGIADLFQQLAIEMVESNHIHGQSSQQSISSVQSDEPKRRCC